jgi:multiple sugar transport system substrate-binding protein
VRIRRSLTSSIVVLALALAACGGDDGDAGDQGSARGTTLTVWNQEFQPDRMRKTQAILDDFTAETGIKTKLVPVPDDQLATLITNAAAAGDLPDVVLATTMADSQGYAAQGIFDPEAAQAVVDRLGPETFSQKALDLVSADGVATGVPSDAWGMLLIYRSDLFDEAGLDAPETLEDVRVAAERLHGDGRVGIALATAPGDGFTAETVEHIALMHGCELVDADGNVTFDAPECVEALRFYGDLAANYSAEGSQDVESTRATYFAGRAAMVIWSPFILDGLAGLRDDTKPSCPECKRDPRFLAENSGLVGPLEGPSGERAQFGVVSTLNISVDADTEAAQQLVEFMLTKGYTRWLAVSPQGKYPVRAGATEGSTEFADAWQELESGVDRKAPLRDVYSEESVAALGESVESFNRWAFTQGQGALLGALLGEQPIAKAGADVIAGKDPAGVARDTKEKVEEIQASLE